LKNLQLYTFLFTLLSWLYSSMSYAFPIAPYEARYSVSYLGIPAGESVHILHEKADGSYHFESRTKPNMQMLPYLYHESTDFVFKENTVFPEKYSYNIKEGKRRKQGKVNFDWLNKTLSNKNLKDPWHAEITDGLQDKLTQTLCLRQALKSGSKTLSYMVAEEDKIKQYDFTILGEERLKTKLGTLHTVKIEHISRKGVRTTMWFAKQFDYLPVKMTQARKGKIVADGEILTFTPRRGYARTDNTRT
jgi:hypothetical protein